MTLIFFLVSLVAKTLIGTNVQVAYGPDNLPIQYSTQTGEVIPNLSGPPQVAGYFIAQAATPTPEPKTIQLRTFPVLTVTPSPTPLYTPKPTSGSLTPTAPGAGAPVSGKQYCVDEAPGQTLIESCDDTTRCDVAHGGGGPSGSCGTVIGWEHVIIESLLTSVSSPYYNTLVSDLPSAITNTCSNTYTAQPASPLAYISTFNVIDSYNLAGFREFSRGIHAAADALTNAWKTTTGYSTATSTTGLTPGDAVLFSNPPHVGIVNTVEIDTNGNGDIWFLHTGAAYHLGKLIVFNWNVVESSTGDMNVVFGSHQFKGPDVTVGETVCYCDDSNPYICYQWKFQ